MKKELDILTEVYNKINDVLYPVGTKNILSIKHRRILTNNKHNIHKIIMDLQAKL